MISLCQWLHEVSLVFGQCSYLVYTYNVHVSCIRANGKLVALKDHAIIYAQISKQSVQINKQTNMQTSLTRCLRESRRATVLSTSLSSDLGVLTRISTPFSSSTVAWRDIYLSQVCFFFEEMNVHQKSFTCPSTAL